MIARACGMAALLAGGALLVQPREARPPEVPLRFVDVAAESGSRNVHRKPVFSSRFANIMPGMSALGAAVAAGDYDGDGRVDFYVTNSARGSGNRLFRNLGDGRFEDVAARTGVAACNREGVSMDAVFFDADNDGDQDLYVAVWGGANQLYENLGGGAFRDVTRRAGVGFQGYANGVIAFDYDRDGLLDLFVANYFPSAVADPVTGRPVRNDLWNPVTTRVMHSSFTHAANGGRNVLYRNQGDGTFRDVTAEAGLRHTGWSLDPGAGDLNNDGWPDLYVANDYGPDELYFNTGAGERPPRFRLAVDPDGHPGVGADWWKGMNAEMGDVDGNGRLDVYVTNILSWRFKTDEGNMLWLNYPDAARIGGSRFVNRSEEAGTLDGGWGWAAKLADFNHDGLLDLLALNGFVTGDPGKTYWYQMQDLVTQTRNSVVDARDWPAMEDRDLSGGEPSRLFLQLPPQRRPGAPARRREPEVPRFADVAREAGVLDEENGRGIALADLEDDGDLDFYIANQGAASCLYRNELLRPGQGPRDGAHWLGLRLVGAPALPRRVGGRAFRSSRDAVGARVELWAGGRYQMRELGAANGFASQSEGRIHFGLGQARSIDRLVVTWPSGRRTALTGAELAADRYHLLSEAALASRPAEPAP